jgi:Cu-Zn family superoxide dismutase
MKRWMALGAAAVAVAGAGIVTAERANADQDRVTAVLRDPGGARVGVVVFTANRGTTVVAAILQPNQYVAPSAFHGFHVHANDNPSNGTGCVADAARPSSTWFVSADAHFAGSGSVHPDHDGDMPSPLVNSDGVATLIFTTHRLRPSSLLGKAVVLHAGRDDFGNVPLGSGADQYTANSPAAVAKTLMTGNSGDRVACGVVVRQR